MSDYFISRSGTRHIPGVSDSRLHGGRIVALCGFSQSLDEEPPGEELQMCGWCLKAEERARRIAQEALEAAGQPGKVLSWPARDPEAIP
jgi:hypothetical protein